MPAAARVPGARPRKSGRPRLTYDGRKSSRSRATCGFHKWADCCAPAVPQIADKRTCPRCGLEMLYTEAVPRGARCDDCGAVVEPHPIGTDTLKRSSPAELEAGAAAIREMVAKMKRCD